MGFKAMVAADIAAVILNLNEYAESHTVRYDGETYDGVPVVLQKKTQAGVSVSSGNRAEGLRLVSAVAYLSADALGGALPERGKYVEIDDGEALGRAFFERYLVVTSKIEMGLITLELRYYDE